MYILLIRFPSIPHLRMLDLSRTVLRKVGEETFSLLSQLEVLNLSENRLRRAEPRVFDSLVSLKSLLLSGNPWLCDCRWDCGPARQYNVCLVCRLSRLWSWTLERQLYHEVSTTHPPALCDCGAAHGVREPGRVGGQVLALPRPGGPRLPAPRLRQAARPRQVPSPACYTLSSSQPPSQINFSQVTVSLA